jgi:2-polyprenyl-3-methyl-5-hydroxy-6-metoxy-1,4-benzoquinol methylase
MVEEALVERGLAAETLLDVGAGAGGLFPWVQKHVGRYVGADIVRYQSFPDAVEFVAIDLDSGRLPFADSSVPVVTCLETIEHVENPRALLREIARVTAPGGWMFVTTPNQLSLASKLCLVFRDEFLHFQERPGLYPAHISALLEVDLRRMAQELGLVDVQIAYTGRGRVPFSSEKWPAWLSKTRGRRARLFSDNVLLAARKPEAPSLGHDER